MAARRLSLQLSPAAKKRKLQEVADFTAVFFPVFRILKIDLYLWHQTKTLLNMKSKFLAILVISMISVITLNGQAAAPNKLNPVGQWSYAAPYAPEGYQSGTVEIGLTDGKYTASFSVTGSDYKMPAEKVKFENDVVSFIVMIECKSD
ncbi:MAG: hypothetical protein MZV63_36460 [Marinilabiliales bacterium]|nr:hypothetical protein [Marinilabiliales bacterium]